MAAPASLDSSWAVSRDGSRPPPRCQCSRRVVGEAPGALQPAGLARYLAGVLGAHVEVLALRPLGSLDGEGDDPKALGYGTPLEVECTVDGSPRHLVLSRTRPTQGFGHDYPADRAWHALYGHPAYNSFPRHARRLDVGFARAGAELASAADASASVQVVEKVPARLSRFDLEHLLEAPLRPLAPARAAAIARSLVGVHADKRQEPTLYERRIRELVGHGECLMGILD